MNQFSDDKNCPSVQPPRLRIVSDAEQLYNKPLPELPSSYFPLISLIIIGSSLWKSVTPASWFAGRTFLFVTVLLFSAHAKPKSRILFFFLYQINFYKYCKLFIFSLMLWCTGASL